MITPSFSSTATERVLPRLALDFTTGVLDPRVTVARALNTATRVNSSGLIEIVNANLPRFDYDPVTLAAKGLLIEEQRTNALSYSEELSNPVWTTSNSSIVDNSATSPSGLVNADTLVENTATSTHSIQSTASVVGIPVVCSFYAKKKERSKVGFGGAGFNAQGFQAVWDLDNGTVFINIGGRASIQALSNGWYRCSVAFTPSNTSGTLVLLCDDTGSNNYAGDGSSGLYLWGMQTEAGAFATSYIPTVASSVTRNADVVTMTGANFSDWYNQSQGAFVAEFQTTQTGNLSATGYVLAMDASGAKRVIYTASATDTAATFDGATIITATGDVTGSVAKVASAYDSSGRAIVSNGGTVATGAVAAGYSNSSSLNIGNVGLISQYNGHIRSIRYWPQRLTNAELRAFSK